MVDDTLAGDRVAIDRPRLHRRLRASQYLRNNVLLFAAAMLAGFGNYLMHPLMLRLLGVENYGAVISIVTLTGILAIPVPVITIVVTSRHQVCVDVERRGEPGTVKRQSILIVLRHQTIGQLVEAVILAHAVLLVFMLALFAVHTRQSRPPGRVVLRRRLVNWGWL